MSSNALGWVFPPAGQSIPSIYTEVNFGPVHLGDSMVIQFTPASFTGDIKLYCDYQNAAQGNVWDLVNTGSPLTYIFNQTTPNPDDISDYHACHFLFAANTPSTSSGNTKAFQYLNVPGNSVVTWTQGSTGGGTTSSSRTSSRTSTTSSTISSSTTSATSSRTSQPSSSSSTTLSTTSSSTLSPGQTAGQTSPSSTTAVVSSPAALGPGAIAGIVIGIVALIALLIGLGFFFGRRHRRNATAKSTGPLSLPPDDPNKIAPMYGQNGEQGGYPPHAAGGAYAGPQMSQQGYIYGTPGQAGQPAWAGKQYGQSGQVRMGELGGEQINEIDTRVVHEIGGGTRNELPG